VSHLEAALALWQYADASAAYIFGDALGDALADEILHMLRAVAPDGMTRTDMYNAFGRNKKSTTIQQALAGLWRHQLVTYTKEATEGRPIERWYARLSSSASTQKTHLTQKGATVTHAHQAQAPLNAFNAFNAYTQGENGTQDPSAPATAFSSLTASSLWCSTCAAPVSFRTLTQLDGTEVYLCNTCDTEVGQKRSMVPPASNGTHTSHEGPLATPTSSEDEDDFDEVLV
jgi:hypothetical protein